MQHICLLKKQVSYCFYIAHVRLTHQSIFSSIQTENRGLL